MAPTGAEQRKAYRVTFERGFQAQMMAIDGTWRRDCTVKDVSDSGARLAAEGSLEGLMLKEFFLLLASRGLAYRRCELAYTVCRISCRRLVWVAAERLNRAAASFSVF